MSEETKRQVMEMSVGILFHNAVLAVLCLVWFRTLSAFLGIILGILAAEALLVSMAHSTELCVEAAEEEYAKRKMIIHALARFLILAGGLILCWKFTDVSILTAAIGILGLKTGAYLYPAVHKFLNHRAS